MDHELDMHEIKKKRPHSKIADRLDRISAWVYRGIIRGPLGKIFTSYDRVEANRRKDGRLAGRGSGRPMSAARRALLSQVENGQIVRAVRALAHFIFNCPVSFYGLFFLFYGLAGVGVYFFPQLMGWVNPFTTSRLVMCLVMAILAIPMVISSKSLSYSLGTGLISGFLLIKCLGIPKDGLIRTERPSHRMLPYVALLLAIPCAISTWFIHPLVIPAVVLLLGALGMIFAYPEVGVVLSTALLPTLWMGKGIAMVMVGMILLTWLSYGVKWLFCHRVARWGTLDIVVLIFQGLVLLSGMTGMTVTGQTVADTMILFVLMSLYFLITNLMTTRAYIKRCFFGVSVSFILVILMGCLKRLPEGGLDWLGSSPAGRVMVTGISTVTTYLSGLWQDQTVFALVMLLPFLAAGFGKGKGVLRYLWLTLLMALAGATLLWWSTPALWICAVSALLIFAFLSSHHALTAGMVAVLPVSCVMWWLSEWAPMQITAVMKLLFGGIGPYRETLSQNVWRMILDHPAGIGWGKEAFVKTYASYADSATQMATGSECLYLELLTYMGWQGMILFAVMIFFFMQKSFSAVRYTGNRWDRRLMLAGISGVAVTLLLGIARGILGAPTVFMIFWMIISLTSAYGNVIFDECDVLMVDRAGTSVREDRIFRVGL